MSNSIAMMVDIETLSRKNSAYVAQIGYCVANLDTGAVLDTGTIDLANEGQEDRHREDETVNWWLSQDKEVFQAVFQGENRISVEDAFKFLKGVVERHEVDSVWAKQASFDFAILSDLWDGRRPWGFRSESEMRVMNRYLDPDGQVAKSIEAGRKRLAHHAGDDASFQMEVLVKLHQRIKRLIDQDEGRAQKERKAVGVDDYPITRGFGGDMSSRLLFDTAPIEQAYKAWDRLEEVGFEDDRLIEAVGHFPRGAMRDEIYEWLENESLNFYVEDVLSGVRIDALEAKERGIAEYLNSVGTSSLRKEAYNREYERWPGETFHSFLDRCIRTELAKGVSATLFPDDAFAARNNSEIDMLIDERGRVLGDRDVAPFALDKLQQRRERPRN